jgi:hypothetical protein
MIDVRSNSNLLINSLSIYITGAIGISFPSDETYSN